MKVVSSIEHSVIFDTRFLFSIQELVIAGFRSRHKAVVNESIVMWNNTFGAEGTLEYPQDLRTILQKLRSMTELKLPNFPDLNSEIVSRVHVARSDAKTDIPRLRLHLCILSTRKTRRRCNRSLSCPLLDLRRQLIY